MSFRHIFVFLAAPIPKALVFATGAWLVFGGCGQPAASIDPHRLAAYQEQFLLSEEPAGAIAVLEVRELLSGPVDDVHAHLAPGEEEHGIIDAGAGDEIEFTADDLEVEGTEVQSAPATDKQPGPKEVVVVGQIGGMPNPWCETEPDFPWKRNMATFFLVDPGTAAEVTASGHNHEDSCDCPFCARHAADNATSIAVVNFLDDQGEVIDIAADELLGIEEDETVVVRGMARMEGGEMLVIDATGIYARR